MDLVACDAIILVTTSGQLYRIRDIFVLFYNVRIPQPYRSDIIVLLAATYRGIVSLFFFFWSLDSRYMTSLLLRRWGRDTAKWFTGGASPKGINYHTKHSRSRRELNPHFPCGRGEEVPLGYIPVGRGNSITKELRKMIRKDK